MYDFKHKPATPGEVLRDGFLVPAGMTEGELASRIGVPLQTINTIVDGQRAVTAETAILLANVFNKTTPEFWMTLQAESDRWQTRLKLMGLS